MTRVSTRQSTAAALLQENFQNMNLRSNNSLGGKQSIGGGGRGVSMGRPSQARLSIYSARPSITHAIKDPRPIKDKKWQQQAIQRLIQFLIQSGFPHPISTKSLTTPSSKDFQLIFKFLYAQLDPYYEFTKKFEEEVPILIKALRYPFADQINKSNLFTVGSLHAWPTLLAMLMWIVDLILAVDQLDLETSGDQVLSEVEQADKMFFEYLTRAYAIWLEGADETEVIDRTLLENFEKKDEKIQKDMDKLNSEFAILEKEWTSLSQSESPLAILEREKTILESDKEKFKTYIAHVQGKQLKLQETCKSLSEEFQASEETVGKLTKEREELQATVDAQDLSPADVDRLNAERDQLAKSLALTSQQLDSTTKQVWNQEIAVQKKMDDLERAVDKVNGLLYKLELLGSKNPAYACVSKEIKLFVQQSRAESMVSVNLPNVVKPALEQLIEQYKDENVQISDESIALQEKIDLLTWNISKKEEELEAIVSSIKNMNEKYNQEKEQVGLMLNSSSQDMDQTERQINLLKTQTAAITTTALQALKKAKIESEAKQRQMSMDREQILAATIKALSTVFSFEQHISQKLDEFDQYVTSFDREVELSMQDD